MLSVMLQIYDIRKAHCYFLLLSVTLLDDKLRFFLIAIPKWADVSYACQ